MRSVGTLFSSIDLRTYLVVLGSRVGHTRFSRDNSVFQPGGLKGFDALTILQANGFLDLCPVKTNVSSYLVADCFITQINSPDLNCSNGTRVKRTNLTGRQMSRGVCCGDTDVFILFQE